MSIACSALAREADIDIGIGIDSDITSTLPYATCYVMSDVFQKQGPQSRRIAWH